MQKFSNLLCVNDNDLPIGEGQFTLKDKIKREGKVHLGIVGSSSHLPDYQSIKNAIKKICNKIVICYSKTNKNSLRKFLVTWYSSS